MHQRWRPVDPSAERGADSLVSQADTQDRHTLCKHANGLDGNARVFGTPGSRRDDDAVWCQGHNLLDPDLIVPSDDRVGAQLAQILRQVVGKRIVVVDDEKHLQPTLSELQGAHER